MIGNTFFKCTVLRTIGYALFKCTVLGVISNTFPRMASYTFFKCAIHITNRVCSACVLQLDEAIFLIVIDIVQRLGLYVYTIICMLIIIWAVHFFRFDIAILPFNKSMHNVTRLNDTQQL